MGDSGCFVGDGSAVGTNNQGAVQSLTEPLAPSVGLTVRVVLLAQWLRGGLAVAVLLTAVVVLLAQVLLGRAWGRQQWPGGSSRAVCPHRTSSTGLESEDIPPCYPGDTRALSPRSAPSTLDFPPTNTTGCPHSGPRTRPPQWAPASSVSRQPHIAQHPGATGRNARSLTPRPRQECAPGPTGLPCWEGR